MLVVSKFRCFYFLLIECVGHQGELGSFNVKQEVAAFYGAGIRCLTAVQQVGCMADDVKLHIRNKRVETSEVFAVQL